MASRAQGSFSLISHADCPALLSIHICLSLSSCQFPSPRPSIKKYLLLCCVLHYPSVKKYLVFCCVIHCPSVKKYLFLCCPSSILVRCPSISFHREISPTLLYFVVRPSRNSSYFEGNYDAYLFVLYFIWPTRKF